MTLGFCDTQPTATPDPKCPRTNPGAVAISEMAASVDKFSQAIIEAMATPPVLLPDSVHLSNAIKTAMCLESSWLTAVDLGTLIDILTNNISNADAYLAVEDSEDVCHAWVGKCLGSTIF
ncbi:hypothetical protein BDQ17DRAFT_1437850 [Cyathus striatus]|nr:hypothetical protein BDQ17DRAFT_1437850 [Cyathus striatus]